MSGLGRGNGGCGAGLHALGGTEQWHCCAAAAWQRTTKENITDKKRRSLLTGAFCVRRGAADVLPARPLPRAGLRPFCAHSAPILRLFCACGPRRGFEAARCLGVRLRRNETDAGFCTDVFAFGLDARLLSAHPPASRIPHVPAGARFCRCCLYIGPRRHEKDAGFCTGVFAFGLAAACCLRIRLLRASRMCRLARGSVAAVCTSPACRHETDAGFCMGVFAFGLDARLLSAHPPACPSRACRLVRGSVAAV